MWRPMVRGATLGVMARKKVSHQQGLLIETSIVPVGGTLHLCSDHLHSVEDCDSVGHGLSGGNLQWFSCAQVPEGLVELTGIPF